MATISYNNAVVGGDTRYGFGTPSTPVMTADSLGKPPKQAQLPPPVIPTQPSQFVNNLQPAIKQGQDGLIQANTREAKQREDVLGRLLGVDDPNSQNIYDNRFKQLGGNDYLKQFTDANTRLAQLQGVFNTGSQKVSSAPGQSQVFEGLQLNEVSRQKAVEVGNQALVVQAMQGNIETARQIALDTSRFASEDRAAKLQSLMAQFQSLDGIVQGQEKQLIDAAKLKAEHEYDALKRAQATIDTAITSGGANVEEMKQLIDPNLTDEQKMGIAQGIINRTAGQKTSFDQNLQTQQLNLQGRSYGKIGTDDFGNDVFGFVDLKTGQTMAVNNQALSTAAPDGGIGGQCGTFAHTICDFPPVGNTLKEKKATVDKVGISADAWRNEGAQPGDVIISSDNPTYGHVRTVIGVNEDGTVKVKDSNYGMDEKIRTYDLDMNNQNIYGVIRGTLKDKFTTEVNNSNDSIMNAMKSVVTAPGITADIRKSAPAELNRILQSGDTERAKQYVFSTAIASLPADQQNKAVGRLQAIDSLNHIKGLLQAYQAKGGNTDILTGTQEQIAQKLGNTSNPELANIGNQIALAMVSYRSMVSGAAFTESEAKLYENIFPSTKNIGKLNDAKINSIIEAFNVNQRTTLSNVLGAKNYDAMMGTTNVTGNSQPSAEGDYVSNYLSSLSSGQPSGSSGNGIKNYLTGVVKPVTNFAASTNPYTAPLVQPVKSIYSYIKSLF